MPRKGESNIDRAVRQTEIDVKKIRARSKKLLKNAQKTIRQYRHELAVLKRQGIVAKRISAKSHQPTRYMMRKIKSYADVAAENALAKPIAKLSPHRARNYLETGVARKEGKFIIVPKTHAKETLKIERGHLVRVRPLLNGEVDFMLLPFSADNLNELVTELRDRDSEINTLKGPRDQLGFQLYGNNSLEGSASAEELANYIERNYTHILNNPQYSYDAVQNLNFVLMRFRPDKGKTGVPFGTKSYKGSKQKRKYPPRRIDPYAQKIKRDRERERKREQRSKESEAQRESRLSAQRERDRRNSNSRRERRLGDRLLPRK